VFYSGLGILVQSKIATINPYTANASHRATTKKALKKASSRSESEEIAAVPTVLIAQALPKTAELTEIAVAKAKAIVVEVSK
jgi:hypothetical protein